MKGKSYPDECIPGAVESAMYMSIVSEGKLSAVSLPSEKALSPGLRTGARVFFGGV